MSQPEYLLKAGRDLRQTDTPRVRRPEKRRLRNVTGVPGVGQVAFTEGTGKYETNEFDIMAPTDSTSPTGLRSGSAYRARADRSAAGVRKVIRRLRPQDAEQIDRVDEQIEELQRKIGALRQLRAQLVKDAWTKGHVVRLQEIEQMLTRQDEERRG